MNGCKLNMCLVVNVLLLPFERKLRVNVTSKKSLLIGRKASVAELLSMVEPLLSIEPVLAAEPLLANFYLLSLHNTAIHFRRLIRY